MPLNRCFACVFPVKKAVDKGTSLGGGISHAEDELLLEPLTRLVEQGSFDKTMPTRLTRASLGNDAGVVGAALLCKAV